MNPFSPVLLYSRYMFSPEGSTARVESVAPQVRVHYLDLLHKADAKKQRVLSTQLISPPEAEEKLHTGRGSGESLLKDPVLVAQWEARAERDAVRAAEYIRDLVGKMSVADLEAAVAPKTLEDVLDLAHADYPAFMIIGKGQDRLRSVAGMCEKAIADARGDVQEVTGSRRTVLDHLIGKMERIRHAMRPLEEKTQWTVEESLKHHKQREEFQTAYQGFRKMIEGKRE